MEYFQNQASQQEEKKNTNGGDTSACSSRIVSLTRGYSTISSSVCVCFFTIRQNHDACPDDPLLPQNVKWWNQFATQSGARGSE